MFFFLFRVYSRYSYVVDFYFSVFSLAVNVFFCFYLICVDPCIFAQNASRPLRVHFERGQLVAEDNVGPILFKKTVGVPRSFSAWQRRYFVLGGAVAKAHVLQVYVSKQVTLC